MALDKPTVGWAHNQPAGNQESAPCQEPLPLFQDLIRSINLIAEFVGLIDDSNPASKDVHLNHI